MTDKELMILGNMLVITDSYTPYDFRNWRECTNFIIDKCYGIKRALSLIKKDKEHLEVRCPLTGEYLTILGSEESLEKVHQQLILQNLYRLYKR